MLEHLTETLPINRWREHGVLAAVSGGADSMAMLHFLVRQLTSGQLAVAHVNHALRGKESDADADFVQKTAEEYRLRYFEHRIVPEEWNADETGSREAAARQIRYDFLLQTAERLGFRYVAAAHTADDQTETVLHRIIRGTGLAGLAGIARFRQLNPAVTLIRPLLDVRRKDILDYLNRLGKPFRTDSTNKENDFTRNRIRNQLLPALRKNFNPKVDEAVNRLTQLAAENEAVLDELMETVFDKAVVTQTPNEIVLDSSVIRHYSTAIIREFFIRLWKRNNWPLRDQGFEQWTKLTEFFCTETDSCEFRGSIIAEHRNGKFRLHR